MDTVAAGVCGPPCSHPLEVGRPCGMGGERPPLFGGQSCQGQSRGVQGGGAPWRCLGTVKSRHSVSPVPQHAAAVVTLEDRCGKEGRVV